MLFLVDFIDYLHLVFYCACEMLSFAVLVACYFEKVTKKMP